MRATAVLLVAAAASAGCLRTTEFRCLQDTECGTGGVCEPVGYCSVPSTACAGTGRAFSDSAGQGLSGECVLADNPGPRPDAAADAGADAAIDGPPEGCPDDFAAIAGSAHRYKRLAAVSWDRAADDCKRSSSSAYLAIPDDLAELSNIVSAGTAPPISLGIRQIGAVFVTEKAMLATFLPWATGQPDMRGGRDCALAVSATEIATDRCTDVRTAVCECEP